MATSSGSTFAALAVRDFRILWVGTWLSFTAFFMSTVVNSVVAFELEGLNTSVGWVVFAQGITMMTLSPIGGAVADRLPKRRVVALGLVVTGSIFLTVSALVAFERIAVVFLAMGSLVMGATFSFQGPARQALVVDLVPTPLRPNAIALATVANTGSRVFGPALAGLFLVAGGAGPGVAYAWMAGLYFLSAALLILLPKSRIPENAEQRGLFDDVAIGLRYVAHTPRLRLLLLFYTLVIMAGFPHITLLPGLLENQLGREASEVSLLFASSAVSALASSLVAARLADSRRGLTYFAGSGLLFALSVLGLGAVPSFAWAFVAMFAVGLGSGAFQTLGSAVAVQEAEPQYVGRVLSLTMLAFAGFGLVGLPVGLIADHVGERETMIGMGLVVLGLIGMLAVGSTRVPARAPRSS